MLTSASGATPPPTASVASIARSSSMRSEISIELKGESKMSKVVYEKMSGGQWVNPSRPTNVQQALKILNDQNYASFDSLCRLLGVNDNVSKDKFYEELQNECASACPSVGEVDRDSATTALLQPRKVFYSKTWVATVSWPQSIGMKIGYHLYRRILDNHWNNYGANGLNFHLLNDNNFDNVIATGRLWNGSGYLWNDFSKLYKRLAKQDK